MLTNVLRIILIIIALILIVVCTIISGKNQNSAGSAFGGASTDNYFNKNKNASKDAQLNIIMKTAAILMVALSVVMVVIQG